MIHRIELLIVGSGPAGQAAAITAAEHGLEVLLVDEGPIPRDWMRRQVPQWYGERPPATDDGAVEARYRAARPALTEAAQRGVDVRLGQFCWGLFDNRVAGISNGNNAELVQADRIILATGSSDLPLPFQGRTLPGVLGGLGALDLLATRGTLGGRRVVILGAGNLGLEVARQARSAGHEVVTVAEISEAPPGDPGRVEALEGAGVEFVSGVTVSYVRGAEGVEQIMLVPVDCKGRRAPGPTYPVRADTVVVAIGRSPALELAYLAGCDIGFEPARGGYVPLLSETLESSVAGIHIAGDAAGAADSTFPRPEIAATQGRIAATACAGALGKLSADEGHRLLIATYHDAVTEPAPADNHGGYLNLWQRAALQLATDDVIICRCEGITRRDLLAAMDVVGDVAPDELKRVTRAGMGQCQGRGCRTIVAGMLAARHGADIGSVPLASYRPPVRPISLGALASVSPPEQSLLPAFAALEARLAAADAAGELAPGRFAAARSKIREENHLALAHELSDPEIAGIVHDLEITVRHVTVH